MSLFAWQDNPAEMPIHEHRARSNYNLLTHLTTKRPRSQAEYYTKVYFGDMDKQKARTYGHKLIVQQVLAAKYILRTIVGQHPRLYFPLVYLSGKNTQLAVNRDTEIVIEGFPRSGNTFAVAAFSLAQNRAVRIARHLHVPAQIERAKDFKIPSIVLVRNPTDTVISIVIREPYLSIFQAYKAYIRYYTNIMPLSSSYVVGIFDHITSDFGAITKKLNERFNTKFKLFIHSKENVQKCFTLVEEMDKQDTGLNTVTETHVARPSATRRAQKKAIRAQIEAARIDRLIGEAEDVYRWYKSLAESSKDITDS